MGRSSILLGEVLVDVVVLRDVVGVGYPVARSASSCPCRCLEFCYCSTFLCEHDEGHGSQYSMISSMHSFGSGATLPMCGKSPDGYPRLRDDILGVSFLIFVCGFSENSDVSEALVHMGLRDSHIACRSAAKIATQATFHLCLSGMRIQVAKELFNTTATTLGLVLALSLLGMLVFTGIVLASISSVGIYDLWRSALLEVLEVFVLVVFAGYAVTYAVHVAQEFGVEGQEASLPRSTFSLSSFGGASLGTL